MNTEQAWTRLGASRAAFRQAVDLCPEVADAEWERRNEAYHELDDEVADEERAVNAVIDGMSIPEACRIYQLDARSLRRAVQEHYRRQERLDRTGESIDGD